MNSLDMPTVSKQTPLVKKQYQFLHVWILREYLNHDLRIENLPEKYEYDVERLIDDFIFICFFGGNDFLPNMPTLDIHEGAIDLLIHVYKQEFKNLGGYLVNTEKLVVVSYRLQRRFFPYHYGPFASDMKGLSSTKAIFQKGFPFKPFDQLMAVLPPTSVDALPPSYRSLMTADDSSILDFYPRDFDVDADGKRFLWLLLFIEEDRLLAATKKIEKELSVRPSDVQNPYLFDQDSDLHVLYLQKEEAKRNTVNADMLFLHGSENLALQIISNLSDSGSIKRKGYMKIDTGLSGDLNGFVHPKLDSENVDNSSGRVKDNDVLCVYYDPPCFSPHIPRVLEGTDIPEPVVSESDIEEGHLWHETDGYPIRTDRSYDGTRNRGVGARSGWTRGRGGFHNVALSSQSASFQDATSMPKQQTNIPSWWDTYGRGSRRNGNGGNHQPIIRQGQTMLKVDLSVRSDSGSDSNQAIRQWGEAQIQLCNKS
ncbi:hypothetical protein L2E82_45506 [Cichorium intybus]|uniref:Uncharacterized protein n=1 Tax=Cichorium intybus TaxID=13427 RepID=A0ACB8ZT67_CICIN|nr:hypothetical protein L2E82_45506 [Cichorium intybus]